MRTLSALPFSFSMRATGVFVMQTIKSGDLRHNARYEPALAVSFSLFLAVGWPLWSTGTSWGSNLNPGGGASSIFFSSFSNFFSASS
jgi:hypothetical protein